MPNRSLSYRVEFDTRSAVRDLQRLTREGKRAGEDIADGFDKTETAGTNALRALTRQLDQLEQDAIDSARAAEAIGRHMAEGFDQSRIAGFVADLRRVGVSYDEIEQKAEEFAAVVKRTDDTDLSGLNSELDQTGAKLDKARDSGDQSRSVLANLAGNSAQSLGELGGVVGDLGVGLGQLVEYAVDGNIQLSNLAKVAGPMAGLAAAGLLVAKVFGDMSKADAFDADRIDGINDAIEESGDAWDYFRQQVAETGEVLTTTGGIIGGFGRKTTDVRDELDRLGLSFEDFQNLVTDPAALQALIDYRNTLSGGEFAQERSDLLQVINAVNDYTGAINEATGARQALQEFLGPPPRTGLADINAELQALNVDADALDRAWSKLIADMADNGVVDSTNEWHQLKQELKLTDAEMADMAQQKLDEYLADVAAQTEATNQALDEARQTIRDINAEPLDMGGALSDLFDLGDQAVDFQGAKAAVDDAIEALQDYVDANGSIDWAALLDVGSLDPSEISAEMIGAVTGARDALQEGIGAAFELGGADAAQQFLDTFVPRLMEAGGLTQAQVYELLGLPPDGNIDAALQPYVDATKADQARRILDALAGTGIDGARVAQIQVAVDTGQLAGEQAAIVAQIEAWRIGVGVFPTVDETTTQAEIDAAQQWLNDHPVTVGTDVDVEAAEKPLRDLVRKTRTAKIGTTTPDAKTSEGILDDVAADRTSTISTSLVQQLVQGLIVGAYLDYVARPRTVEIGVNVTGLATANQLIDYAARDRDTTINVTADTYDLQRAIATAISNAIRLGRVAS